MATNSKRSAGSQVTDRGIVQGTVIIDPVTGLPINVVVDNTGKKRLCVDAALSVESAVIEVELDAETDAVRVEDPDTGAHIKVETDGSINANVKVDASGGDSILAVGTEDGTPTGTQHNLMIDSAKKLVVKDEDTGTKLDSLLTELQQKTEPTDAQNIRTITSVSDSISVPGVATSANQVSQTSILSSIDSKLTSPISIGDLSAAKDDIAIAGTENGTATGTVRHFVNNLRQQILASHDRQQAITYADFGTKDERITSIAYTSPTFTGYTATKTITYTLVSGKYRLDAINWTVS